MHDRILRARPVYNVKFEPCNPGDTFDADDVALLGNVSPTNHKAASPVAPALGPALLTLLFRQIARPDDLGMLLGYANAWWLLLPRRSWRLPLVSSVSGALAGLMLCTSAGVFLAFIPFLAALWLSRVDEMQN